MSNTHNTLGKMVVMQGFLDGKDIIVRKNGSTYRDIRNINDSCVMPWNWTDYGYKIAPVPKPVCVEKYTNVMDNNIYGLFATEKEAIFHSDNRYHRPGVKVLITEAIDD